MPEASVTPLAVYNPTPTVRVDEEDKDLISELILTMDVYEDEGGLSRLELRVSNVASDPEGGADFALENEQDIRLGSMIGLYSGDVTRPQEIFRGIVTGLEADFPKEDPPELVILAEDKLQDFRMTRRSETHSDTSIADLVSNIANRHNLTATVTALTEQGTWVQLNESDLAFLRRILARYDADCQIVGDEIQVAVRQDVQRGLLELELYSQLQAVKFIADLSDQCTEVTVSGWNSLAGEKVSASSTGTNLGPGSGRSGARMLRDAIGERSEHIGQIAVTTNAEATALADAVFDSRARRFVRALGTAEGNPQLRVGTHVNITGVSPRFENSYYVCSAHHHFDLEGGYETHFTAESYALGVAS